MIIFTQSWRSAFVGILTSSRTRYKKKTVENISNTTLRYDVFDYDSHKCILLYDLQRKKRSAFQPCRLIHDYRHRCITFALYKYTCNMCIYFGILEC